MRGDTLTTAIKDEICERLANGEPLRKIVRDKHLPSEFSVYKGLRIDEEFAKQYARARLDQADTYADEIVQIADECAVDVDGDKEHAGATTQAARLRIDARKWAAGKARPKKYGDRVAIGGDSEMDPIQTEEVGSGSDKLAEFVKALAARS